MNYLVDADTIFDFFNGATELFSLFDEVENIYVSAVTQGKLFYKAAQTESEKNLVQISRDFCHLLHIVQIDEAIAMEYAKLKAEYPGFEENKLWLSATAITKDLVLVSRDEDFLKIKNIVVKNFFK